MIVLLVLINPIVTEVMANVRGSESGPGDRNEFIEIYNPSSETVDMVGWYLTDFDANDTICAWQDSTILNKYPDVIINSTLLLPSHYGLILDREYTRPDTDQYQEPYDIPDSTLILTTDDTSLGNGLSTADPVLITSPDLTCSTSFGTPFDTLDTIPFDPGDGISLEIVDITKEDREENWYPSLDSSGSTPGSDNSTFRNFDLLINDLVLHPLIGSEGTDVRIEVEVKNGGLQPVADWKVAVFNDQNRDYYLEESEEIDRLDGSLLLPGDLSTLMSSLGSFSLGEYQIGVMTISVEDINPENDTSFVLLRIVPRVGIFTLSPRLLYPDRDRLQIDYQLPAAGGRLKISLYSDRGQKISDLIDEYVEGTEGTVFWHGQDARIGYYIILCGYEVNGQSYQEKKTFVLAR